MRTSESKTTSQQHHDTKSKGSFFQQEGAKESFFQSEAIVQRKPFFERSAEQEVQAKLTVGPTNDKYEQEADQVADQVVQRVADSEQQATQEVSTTRVPEEVQRMEEEDEQPSQDELVQAKRLGSDAPPPEDEVQPLRISSVQRKNTGVSGGEVPSAFQQQLSNSKGGGQALDNQTRGSMESAFGHNFSNVRVHTGSRAREMSQSIQAKAFTHGNDIYFNEGQYNTASNSGKHLLAHELTHTIQQTGGNKEGKATKHSPTKRIQRFDLWGAARSVGRGLARGARAVGRGVAAGARAVGRGVSNLAEGAMNMGRSALLALVRRVSPDFAQLIERDGITGFLRNLIQRGFRALFTGVINPVRRALNLGGLRARVMARAQQFRAQLGSVAENLFDGIRTVASSVGGFIDRTLSPFFNRIRQAAAQVSSFFGSIRDAIGVPIMNMLRRIGGSIWSGITGFVQRIGRIFTRVKNALGGAWTRVKQWFGIQADSGTGQGGGLWEWVKGKAEALWNRMKAGVEAIKAPLRVVGTILVLLSPAGPALVLWRAWPHIRQAFQWVRQRWRDANVLVRARAYLNTVLFPMLTNGMRRVANGLVQGANWLIGILNRIQAAANGLLNRLGGSILLAPLRGLVNFALGYFRTVATLVRNGVLFISTHASRIFDRLLDFLGKVWEVVRRIIGIVVNPFGIGGLILGLAWQALPDRVKGVIINWIISILIRVIRAIPSNPILSFLWPFVKNGVLGFLERLQRYELERKVQASDKVANIMSGGSPNFAFGFLRGIAEGVWEGITGPFIMIRDMFQLPGLVRNFVTRLAENFGEMVAEARTFLSELAGNAIGTFQSLLQGLRDLLSNPRRILQIIRTAISAAMSAVRGIGASIGERFMGLFQQPDSQIGQMLGNLVGQGLFEAVLAFFTAGGSTAATAVRQVAGILRRIARNLMPIIRRIVSFLPRVRPFINRIIGMFGRARSGASAILQRVRQFINRVMDWFSNILGGRRGRRRRRGRDNDGPDGRRRRDRDGDDDNPRIRLRRAITAIRPRVRRMLRGGVSRFRLRAQLAIWRVRYRLRRLYVNNRPGSRDEIIAQVNPREPVIQFNEATETKVLEILNRLGREAISNGQRGGRELARQRESGRGRTADDPIRVSSGASGNNAQIADLQSTVPGRRPFTSEHFSANDGPPVREMNMWRSHPGNIHVSGVGTYPQIFQQLQSIKRATGSSDSAIFLAIRMFANGQPLPAAYQPYEGFFHAYNRLINVEGRRAGPFGIMGRDLPDLVTSGTITPRDAFDRRQVPFAQQGAVRAASTVESTMDMNPLTEYSSTATREQTREQRRLQVEYAKRMVLMRMRAADMDFTNEREVALYVEEQFEDALRLSHRIL